MEEGEHHVQDALELYAVARLQALSEAAATAVRPDAATKFASFRNYAAKRGLKEEDFRSGKWAAYVATLDLHLPCYHQRLVIHFAGARMNFRNVEKEYRITKKKGDFVIEFAEAPEVSVSLKNYRGRSQRPQSSSGTFNSFPLGFVFESSGVGTFTDATTGSTFRSSDRESRDRALAANGHSEMCPLMRQLDAINDSIRTKFIDAPEFEFFDRTEFKRECLRTGLAGLTVTLEILKLLDERTIRSRLLAMTGFDGKEELLLLYPAAFTDSITVPAFRELRRRLQDSATRVRYHASGQTITFEFVAEDSVLLSVDVPFTINRNGAWISGERFSGERYHLKEGRALAWGQRRPKKSRELATSTNTYANLSKMHDMFIRGCP